MRERKLLQGCLRKGSGIMEELASELLKELNCDTAFSIKLPAGLPLIGGVQLDIAESVVITWVVMAVILILSIILTSNLKVHNVSRRQLVAETIVTKLEGIVTGMIGEEGKRYVPYLVSVLLYLGISNIIGLFGMKPPTKDLNVTAALALMSIILVEAAGIRKKGVGGWIKSFTEPIAIVTPINILEVFIKPLSLCMRLFGNVLGAFVIMELLKLLVPRYFRSRRSVRNRRHQSTVQQGCEEAVHQLHRSCSARKRVCHEDCDHHPGERRGYLRRSSADQRGQSSTGSKRV